MEEPTRTAQVDRYAAFAVAITAIALYARTVGFSFVDWDDLIFIVHNPALTAPSTDSLRLILKHGGVEGEWLYIPVTYLSFFAESAISGGPNSQLVHFTNMMIHALNGALVMRLGRRLGLGTIASTLTALAFVAHPLQVEAVAWAMGRKDLLATLAALIALELWQSKKQHVHWLAMTAVCMAMLAKPTTVILPGIMLLADWYHQRLSRKRLVHLIPSAAIALILLIANLRLGSGEGGMNLAANASRIWQIPWTICDFLQRFLLLQPPDFLYLPHRLTPDTIHLVPWLVIGLLAAALWIAYRTNQRRFIFGIALACIASLPIFNIYFASKIFITADRFTYLPIIGLMVAAASLPIPKAPWAPLALLLLCALPATSNQINYWRDTGTLQSAAYKRNPYNPIFTYASGLRLEQLGLPDAAELRYQTLLRAEPLDIRVHNRLAALAHKRGNHKAARRHRSIASQLQKILAN